MELNETLKKYGFTERHLELLRDKVNSNGDGYWTAAYHFVDSVPILPPLSIKQAEWLFRIVRELKESCQYKCSFHKGPVEWHHPIGGGSWEIARTIGLWLCQAHHSILYGRKEKYPSEFDLNKSIEEMRTELKELEAQVIREFHLDYSLINKH
jgi:hypothetical protein